MGASLGRHLSKPQSGPLGWMAIKLMEKNNVHVERLAVNLCHLQPHHKVLELGFGPGLGLIKACSFIKGGSGEIHGTDISERSRNLASSRLQQQIADGKVHIHSYSVDNMGFEDNTFDRVFHCNCYYFWPDMDKAVGEVKRVMKPGGTVVTTFNAEFLQRLKERGSMVGNIDPQRYMSSLERHGFAEINMKEQDSEKSKAKFHAITAKLSA